MPYETISPNAPENKSDLTQSLVARVPNNPYNPAAVTPQFPTKYDSLVTKTNDQMSPVLVEDETHALTDIDTGNNNRMYLEHQPVLGTEITVDDGVLDTGLTDYQHGIVYFSTMPTGEVLVQYQANPDKYWGEWLTSIQEIIHQVEWLLGAGSTLNEGIRNAEFFLDTLPPEILTRLPRAIHIRAIDRDVEIRSTTDTGSPKGIRHSITLGNGEDHVYVDAKYFVVRRSLIDGPGPSYVGIRLGDETGDHTMVAGDLDVTGITRCGPAHTSANPGITDPAVTGFEGTGLPFTAGYVKHVVYGDQVVFGDQYILGSVIVFDIQENIQVNVFEEDLEVRNDAWIKHNTRLGSTTDDEVTTAGNVDISGGLTVRSHGGAPNRFDSSIDFTDGGLKGPYEQCLVDGLDASYQELVRPLQRDGWKEQHLNYGRRAAIYDGTTTAAGTQSTLVDTGSSSVTGLPSAGSYYPSKFDEGDFYAVILSGDAEGDVIPVKSFDPVTGIWTLTRDASETPGSGVTFRIFHRYGKGDFIAAGVGLNVTIRAAEYLPLVANATGVVKKRVSDFSLPVTDASTLYIFMSNQPGVNGIDQDEPTFFHSTSRVESDQSILIGKVVTAGGAVSSVSCYDINARADTLWVKFDSAAVGTIKQAGVDYTADFRVGNARRRNDAAFRVLLAPDLTGGGTHPDLDNILELPLDYTGWYAKTVSFDSVVFKTAATLAVPFWARFLED